MKAFQIFKPGRHIAASGDQIEFGEADLQAAAAAYDPSVHEAPIVIGHPKDNGPAYGWIASLSYSEGALSATPIQVDADFAEIVKAGRYKKRSASFYTPDSPNNPKPGTYYLRHVGFLGAQPPAVKGLRGVQFSDAETGVVEFADSQWVASLVGTMFRRMRDFFLVEHGQEKADTILPDYLVADLEAEGRKPAPDAMPANPMFNEGDAMTITKEQFDKVQADLAAERTAKEEALARAAVLESENGTLKTRVTNFAERETALQRAAVEAEIEKLVTEGKVLPAQKKAAVDFALSLSDTEATFDFGEGEQKKKVTQRGMYIANLAAGPKLVNYGESAGTGKGAAGDGAQSAQTVAKKARKLVSDRKASGGEPLTYTEAVHMVINGETA